MRVLENIFMAMQSAWLNGQRRRRDALRQRIFASGLLMPQSQAGWAVMSKAWPRRRKAHSV